jgi:hypothetical protein
MLCAAKPLNGPESQLKTKVFSAAAIDKTHKQWKGHYSGGWQTQVSVSIEKMDIVWELPVGCGPLCVGYRFCKI